MTAVTVLPEAEQELWEAVEYYEDKCPGLGFDFEQEVKASVELIQRFPQRWALRDDGTRRYLIDRSFLILLSMFMSTIISGPSRLHIAGGDRTTGPIG